MDQDQIYRALRRKFENNDFKEGDFCPSENELSKEFKVSRTVVRQALQQLQRDGFLETSQGRQRRFRKPKPLPLEKFTFGTHLESPSWSAHLHEAKPKDAPLSLQGPIPAYEARTNRVDLKMMLEELQLKPDDHVFAFQRLRYADDVPVGLQWAVVPVKLVPEVTEEDLVPGGITKRYKGSGIRRYKARASYSPSIASQKEARHLDIISGDPVIQETRISYYRNGKGGQDPTAYEFLLTIYTERTALEFSWVDNPDEPDS